MSIADVSDQEILSVLKVYGMKTTGFLAHVIRHKNKADFRTDALLRRLKAMETKGLVRRVKTSYAHQICWEGVANEQANR